jgi:hypothetical protein
MEKKPYLDRLKKNVRPIAQVYSMFNWCRKENSIKDDIISIPYRGLMHGKRGSLVRQVFLPNDVCDAGLRWLALFQTG